MNGNWLRLSHLFGEASRDSSTVCIPNIIFYAKWLAFVTGTIQYHRREALDLKWLYTTLLVELHFIPMKFNVNHQKTVISTSVHSESVLLVYGFVFMPISSVLITVTLQNIWKSGSVMAPALFFCLISLFAHDLGLLWSYTKLVVFFLVVWEMPMKFW